MTMVINQGETSKERVVGVLARAEAMGNHPPMIQVMTMMRRTMMRRTMMMMTKRRAKRIKITTRGRVARKHGGKLVVSDQVV